MNQLEYLIRYGDEDKAVAVISQEFHTMIQQIQDLNIKVKRRDALLSEISFKCESRPRDAFSDVLIELIRVMKEEEEE